MKTADIYKWLSEDAYWCAGIPFQRFKTSFDNSFCIGALIGETQVGYGRLVTDYASFAYLADVFVTEPHRGKGISKKMMEVLFGLEWVMQLRRIMLATRDAHGLYTQVGFAGCTFPERLMEITRPGIYTAPNEKNK